MRKIYKVIGGMLMVGVLVTGIGSGVAFAEYSTFEYGGETLLEGSERFTKTVEYKVSKEEDSINIYSDHHWNLVEDADVPKDTVWFVIHYLSDDKDVNPDVVQMSDEGEEYIYIDSDYQHNDLGDVMRAKDSILADLRVHKICDYQYDGVEVVEIMINPEADFEITMN